MNQQKGFCRPVTPTSKCKSSCEATISRQAGEDNNTEPGQLDRGAGTLDASGLTAGGPQADSALCLWPLSAWGRSSAPLQHLQGQGSRQGVPRLQGPDAKGEPRHHWPAAKTIGVLRYVGGSTC